MHAFDLFNLEKLNCVYFPEKKVVVEWEEREIAFNIIGTSDFVPTFTP